MKAGDKTRLELPGREVVGTIIEVTELTNGFQRVKIAYPSYYPRDLRCWADDSLITQVFDTETAHLEIVLKPEGE